MEQLLIIRIRTNFLFCTKILIILHNKLYLRLLVCFSLTQRLYNVKSKPLKYILLKYDGGYFIQQGH